MDSNNGSSASSPSDTMPSTIDNEPPQYTIMDASTRFSFQHFDQESDFGFEDENGERVRKRKRPGRKPNPPSVQERRAQNRAAQRAFREREQRRKEEKERENQAHLDELIRLRKRLAEVQYEANYLRGCVLLLCLTSLVERGSVPHIWTDTRLFPITWNGQPPVQPEDNVNSIPAILRTVLGKDNQILDFQSSLMTARCTGWSLPDQIEQLLNGVDKFIPAPREEQQKQQQQQNHIETGSSVSSASSSSSGKKRRKSYNNEETNTILEQRQLQDIPYQQKPQQQTLPSLSATPHRNTPTSLERDKDKENNEEDEEMLSPYTGTESMVQHFTATKNVYGTVSETPTLKTPDDLTHLPSLQALHILKIQLKAASVLGDKTRIALTPTALQRLIPHDIRIDYCPGPSLRDRMILFQDYYDADEVFELLSTKTRFIGGDTRDARNWVPDPKFSERYWFLSHQLVDYHSGECALIPEFIDAILASQREKEEEMKRMEAEKKEQLRQLQQEKEKSSKRKSNNSGNSTTTSIASSSSTTSSSTSSTRRPPISSVRKERSSNIRSLPLDL